MHEKLIFVDSNAVWIDSLNALSFTGLSGEVMVYSFLRRNGMDSYNPALFLDLKLALQEVMLKKLPTFDPTKGAKFLTYMYESIGDAFTSFRMREECWTIDSLDIYKGIPSSVSPIWQDLRYLGCIKQKSRAAPRRFGAAHVFTDFISDGNMPGLSFIPRLKTYPGIFRSPALPCSTPAISHQGQEYGQ